MPIYSYAEESLTLSLNPRLKRIINLYKNKEPIDTEDIGYLIDSAARWSTFEEVINSNRSVEIDISKGNFGSNTLDIGDIIKNIVQETAGLSATKFNSDVTEYYIDTLKLTEYFRIENSPVLVIKAFKDGLRTVKELQKDFDNKSDGVCVIGYLNELDIYKPNFYFKADTNIEDVIKNYFSFKKTNMEKELTEQANLLKSIETEMEKLN